MEKISSYPEVSVIIPLYNAEKYIADALESLLIQTFKNFEVIVVNDCSTDSSCAIVESYAPRFGGRLTLSHMRENTGSGALPRNKGMRLSRGEYIAFLDNDDLFTPTALEEFYTLAKDYDADVVYCEDNYAIKSDGTEIHREVGTTIDKPTLETNDMTERVRQILRSKYGVMQWRKFTRRTLIFEHEIFFPNVRPSDDNIWTYSLVFWAKNFLRVPNITYIRRLTEDSIMRTKRTPQQTINFWINPVLLGTKTLYEIMSKINFFRQNPLYQHAILNHFITVKLNLILEGTLELQPFGFYDTVKKEFGSRLGEYDVLISALCAFINTQQKIGIIDQQNFKEFATKAQARIAELEAELNKSRL